MIANLPLVFTNGKPILLSAISIKELEKFISFMVTCSWGHDTARQIRKPPWWPQEVAFAHPFRSPPECPRYLRKTLIELVHTCYEYHKSSFLLAFSAKLARYPRKHLRYVDNRDGTTSLYYVPSGALLVTFRNENLNYDIKHIKSEPVVLYDGVYLCEYCDSHFNNVDNFNAHERLCNKDCSPVCASSGELLEFVSALNLRPVKEVAESTQLEPIGGSRTIRSSANIDRGSPYPFSSLAYLKNVKNSQRDLTPRDKVERYCSTSDININSLRSLGNKSKNSCFPVKYRRPIDYWYRKHKFVNQRKKQVLSLNSQLLLLKCKPLQVNVERIPLETIEEVLKRMKESKKYEGDDDIEFVAEWRTEGKIEELSNFKEDPLNHSQINLTDETIDLCSDDDSSGINENSDPRAGVACVMRGGAILSKKHRNLKHDKLYGVQQTPSVVMQTHVFLLTTPGPHRNVKYKC